MKLNCNNKYTVDKAQHERTDTHTHAHSYAYKESAAQAGDLDMTKTQLKDRKALFPHQGRLL